MKQEQPPGALGSNVGLGALAPMEQLLAFCDWERKHNPHPEGKPHVAEWAADEINRLRTALEEVSRKYEALITDPPLY